MENPLIENFSGKLNLSDILVKQLAQQIVNEQILQNWKLYLVLIALIFTTTAFSSLTVSYYRKRGENLATKVDFEGLLKQIKDQTKVTEEVKIAISHGDWARKE